MLRLACVLLFTLTTTAAILLAQPASLKRYALVVGSNQYDPAKLGKLDWAVNDAEELGKVLREGGYEVVELERERGLILDPSSLLDLNYSRMPLFCEVS